MNITIWTDFSKRTNSTKQPAANTGTVINNVYYKEDCDIDAPVLTMAATYSNIVYAKIEDKYFFVDSVTRISNDTIQVSFVLDHLATYKTDIGNTKAFIAYDTSANTLSVPDGRIKISPTITRTKNSVAFLQGKISQQGRAILCYTGKHGNGTVSVDMPDIPNLLPSDSQVNTQWDNIWENVDLSSIGASLKAAVKILASYGTIESNIHSLIWVPFDSTIISGNAQTLYLGAWQTGINMRTIDIRHMEFVDDIIIPWTAGSYNNNYAEISLSIPYIGNQIFRGSDLFNATGFRIRSILDKYTGEISSEIRALYSSGNKILSSHTFSTAADLTIGRNNGFNSVKLADMLIQSAPSQLLNLATMNLAGNISNASANLSNAMHYTTSSFGGNSGSTMAWLNTQIECVVSQHSISDTETNLLPVLGNPQNKAKIINTVPGYVQTIGASVSIAAEKRIRDLINNSLDSGIYYE